MNVPPLVLDVHITSPDRPRPIHLWLPLFLLWPFAILVGGLLLVPALLVDLILLLAGQRYHHYSVLLVRLFELSCDTRGTVIRIDSDEHDVAIEIQ